MTRAVWLAIGVIGGLLLAEQLRPRRGATQPRLPRLATNLALGAIDMAVVAAVEQPLARALAVRVEAERQGLAQALPAPLRAAAAFVLLDWSMYHWHVATHRVPLLWRLHRVHHADRDMDATTALRFHVADMLVSVPLRLAQVRLLGVGPAALAAWQAWFFGSVLFHHADIDVPDDDRLAWLLTTPGMHDIHHRADAAAGDSNFSSGLSLWDRLHGTFRSAAPAVPIGLPEAPGAAQPGLAAALLAPFKSAGSGSALPASATRPARRRG